MFVLASRVNRTSIEGNQHDFRGLRVSRLNFNGNVRAIERIFPNRRIGCPGRSHQNTVRQAEERNRQNGNKPRETSHKWLRLSDQTLYPSPDGDAGLQIFVYGRSAFGASADGPKKFPARQTLEASQAIARLHQLDPAATLFLRQHPAAIDAGAFHNDVVAVGNGNVLFFHELAFADSPSIASPYRRATGREPVLVEVPDAEISLADAVRSYLFNSQLVTLPDGTMALICPAECGEITSTREFLARLPDLATPIRAVHFVDIRQSMNNGGGPACLRLRVVLTEAEQAAAAPGVFLTNALYEALCAWVQRHYRDRLSPDDLADPKLLEESRTALDELTKILGINWE